MTLRLKCDEVLFKLGSSCNVHTLLTRYELERPQMWRIIASDSLAVNRSLLLFGSEGLGIKSRPKGNFVFSVPLFFLYFPLLTHIIVLLCPRPSALYINTSIDPSRSDWAVGGFCLSDRPLNDVRGLLLTWRRLYMWPYLCSFVGSTELQ